MLQFIIIIGVILLLPLIVGVFVTYSTIKFKTKPTVGPVDLSSVDGLRYETFQETKNILEAQGCRMLGDFLIEGLNTAAKTYSRWFVDSTGSISGHISQIISLNAQMILIELCSEFEDGTQLNTRNDSLPQCFKRKKIQPLRQFPNFPADKLLEAHRQYLGQLGKDKILKNDLGDDIANRIDLSCQRELSSQVKFGILKIENNLFYSPTLYGALYMTFRQWLYMIFKYNPSIVKKYSLSGKAGQDFTTPAFKPISNKLQTLKMAFTVMIAIAIINLLKPQENRNALIFRLSTLIIGLAGLFITTSMALRRKK